MVSPLSLSLSTYLSLSSQQINRIVVPIKHNLEKTTVNLNIQLKRSFSASISFQHESVCSGKRASEEIQSYLFFLQKMNPLYEFIFWQCMKKVAPFQNCTLAWCVYSTRSHFTHSNRNVYHKLIFNCIKNVLCVWCEKLVYALPWFDHLPNDYRSTTATTAKSQSFTQANSLAENIERLFGFTIVKIDWLGELMFSIFFYLRFNARSI